MTSKGIMGMLIFALLFFIQPYLYGDETGFKYFKNYSYKEYGHQTQNWGIVQSDNGIIYVANQGGVLEYDGVSWRRIGVPGSAPVRSLAIAETGTIYIGGECGIGYLAPDDKGDLTYRPLEEFLPADKKDFSMAYRTFARDRYVYFDTSKYLLRWDVRQRKFAIFPRDYNAFLICGEKLFIRKNETGLEQVVQMENNRLKTAPVPGGEEFAGKSIYMMIPYDSRKMLIGTFQNGLYIHDGKTTTPFPTWANDYLKKNRLYHGTRLRSGDLALATLHGGLFVLSPRGGLKHIFYKSYGLQDEKVNYIFEDNQGNLWLCLDNGISKIEYNSPISYYDGRSGLPGLVYSIVSHRWDLYVGTSKGLYYQNFDYPQKFGLITHIPGNCRSIILIDDSLLTATTEGVFQITEKTIEQRIVEHNSYALLPSHHHPGLIWCGTASGLFALSGKNGRWKEEYRFEKIDQAIRFIVEDRNGNLWLTNSEGGVLKVSFTDDIRDYTVITPGLPGGEVNSIAAIMGRVILATQNGLFRFDEKAGKFIPNKTLGSEFAGGQFSKPVFRLVEDENKHIWFHSQSRNYCARSGPGGVMTIDSIPFRRIPPAQVNVIYTDPYGRFVWFGGTDGLIRYDTSVKKDYRQDFKVLVRRVLVNDTLIFNGCKNKTAKSADASFPVFECGERNFRFEFAAPFFEAESETQYRYFLEGFDENWSSWSNDIKRNYTSLSPGKYTFRVQARNVYLHQGEEDVFHFKVSPPWYITWWASLLYLAMCCYLAFYIARLRTRKLESVKLRLEQILKERTDEINHKNQEIEKLTLQLKD